MAPDDFIPNQWYPIFDSSKLKRRKPVGVTRLGERLVLWRDGSGAAVCMTDRCPHRAAQLSLGWVRDDCLACPFHGLRFDSAGRCVLIPANGEAPAGAARFRFADASGPRGARTRLVLVR